MICRRSSLFRLPVLPGSEFGTNLFVTSDVEGDGFELSGNWLLTSSLELFFNAGYLDAEYTRRDERKVVEGECQVIDRAGEKFAQKSPEVSFSVGGTYTLDFKSGASATDWEPGPVVNSGQPGGIGGELTSDFSDCSPTYERREEPRMYGLELRYNW